MTRRTPRIAVIGVATALALSCVAARLFYVQIVKAPTFKKLAENRQIGTAASIDSRGEIVDRNGDVLAISVPAVSVYAHPSRLSAEDRQAAAWRSSADSLDGWA